MKKFRSPLGSVVILKMPIMDNESKLEFYRVFHHHNNEMYFGCIQDESPNMIVAIDESSIHLVDAVKDYITGVVDINDLSEIPCSKEDNICIGNKLLQPSR